MEQKIQVAFGKKVKDKPSNNAGPQKTTGAARGKVIFNVHKMARATLTFIFLIALCANAWATTYEWEHQSKYMVSGVYGWISSYDIGFYNDTLMVDVDIYLTGYNPGDTLKNRWESGIESIWSTNRFSVPISFNVDWVTTGYDYAVNVINGTSRWNMLNWYTIGAGGWGDAYQEEVAAHEYGHMIGEWDEYSGGAVDPVTKLINTGGIMQTLNGGTLDYYYASFLAWYDNKLNSVPVIDPVVDPIGETPVRPNKGKKAKSTDTPVPEPNSLLFLGLGLIGLAGVSRKFQHQPNITRI